MYDGEGHKNQPPPASFNFDIRIYEPAIAWLKNFIFWHHGHVIARVTHDAYPNLWRCYDDEGLVVVNIDHQLMCRLALVLEQIEWEARAMEIEDDNEEAKQKWLMDEEDDGG